MNPIATTETLPGFDVISLLASLSSQSTGDPLSPLTSPMDGSPPPDAIITSPASLLVVNTLLRLKRGANVNYTYGKVPDPWQGESKVGGDTAAKTPTETPRSMAVLTRQLRLSKRKPRKSFKGRPYSQSLHARFFVHESLSELVCYLKRVRVYSYTNGRDKSVATFSATGASEHREIMLNVTGPQVGRALERTFRHGPFLFVRVIRNRDGNLLKVELVEPPAQCDVDWVKKHICFPRYKANMKIHLVWGPAPPQVIYFDARMYQHDAQSNPMHGVSVSVVE